RDNGPAVFLGAILDVALAGVDHGLDREGHAGFEFFQRAGAAVMQHLRFFMKAPTYAMTAKLAHDAKTLFFREGLDGKANVAQPCTGLDTHDALPHGLV